MTTKHTKEANELIIEIAVNLMDMEIKPLKNILQILEDGEALESLGFDDQVIPIVEEAHSIIKELIKLGYKFYEKELFQD